MKKILLLLLFVSSNSFAVPFLFQGYLRSCDENADGIEVFNLTEANNQFMYNYDPASFNISYHYTEADATAQVGAISSATNFISGNVILFVRVQSIIDNTWATTRLNVNVYPVPTYNQPQDIIHLQNPYTGIDAFNFQEIAYSISPDPYNYVSFYETLADAELDVNPILNCSYYNLSVNQNIYVRITNPQSYCYATTSFNIGVIAGNPVPSPAINFTDLNFKAKLLEADVTNQIAQSLCGGINSYVIDKNNDGEIQVSEALQVGYLNLSNVSISNLDGLQYFINLDGLNIENVPITSIDVSMFPKLNALYCINTLITTIDVSNNPRLCYFTCINSPNLTSVFMKNGPYGCFGEYFIHSNNPLLQYVCTDEDEIYYVVQQFEENNINNVVVNSYCTFNPAGNYNTINGHLKFDGNNNGCDINDFRPPFVKLNFISGTTTQSIFTTTTQDYLYTAFAGNFTVTPEIENSSFFTISPVVATVNFSTANSLVETRNFCITPNGVHPDIEIAIAPIVPARPGFPAIYEVVYKNIGNQVLNQQYGISFFFNQNLMTFTSSNPAPETQNLGALNWSVTNLQPFESRSIYVTMNINAPTATNPVNINDVLTLTANAIPAIGETNTQNNLFQFNQTVVGSYDPNDKQCVEGEIVNPIKIGEYLHYLIRFENTGNFYAQNIVVKDVIDASKFDVSSLQIMSSSHPVEAKVRGNIAEFIFQDIYLDSGGHGNILLKLKTKATLPVGTTVSNKADIFFDYNHPIITNIANTTFTVLSVPEKELDRSISIYPNPTNDLVNIKAASVINSIQVYDIQGRILITKLLSDKNASVDLSNYSSGIYYLKINTDKGAKTEKLVKK